MNRREPPAELVSAAEELSAMLARASHESLRSVSLTIEKEEWVIVVSLDGSVVGEDGAMADAAVLPVLRLLPAKLRSRVRFVRSETPRVEGSL